jgi:hypothetical protein
MKSGLRLEVVNLPHREMELAGKVGEFNAHL